jgi:hypothetical protein
MRHARRVIYWVLFLAALLGVGVTVFAFVRHRPRCTIVGPLALQVLTADGSRMLTLSQPGGNALHGPLQVWDTHSGHLIHELFRGARVHRSVRSPDGAHVAFNVDDGSVQLVNWHTGEAWQIDEPRDIDRLEFSPRGRWLFIGTARQDISFLVDTTTRQVVWRGKDYWLRITDDDRVLLNRKGPGQHVTVTDLETGKVRGVLPLTSAPYDLAADGRLLLEQHRVPVPAPVEKPDNGLVEGRGVAKVERKDLRVDIWELATCTHRFGHALPQGGNLQAALSPDSRFLAMWLRDEKTKTPFELIDTANGKVVVSFPMTLAEDAEFSPDGSLVYLVHGLDREKSQATLTMFDLATGRVLWQQPGYATTRFAGATGVLLQQEDFNEPFRFLDARTGKANAAIPLDFPTMNYVPVLTADGKHFVIGGFQQRAPAPHFWETWLVSWWPEVFANGLPGVLVMESATGRELFRTVNRGGHSYMLSDDASTLITIDPVDSTGSFAIRAFDVHPTRAWLWTIGVTLVAGMLVYLGGVTYRRRRTTFSSHGSPHAPVPARTPPSSSPSSAS